MNAPKQLSSLQRRQWLARMAARSAGWALAVPGARLAFAAGPSAGVATTGQDHSRLVVVMLRGALDGLAAVPALGDPAWPTLRPPSADDERQGVPLPLDGMFALHSRLSGLHGWYRQGELLVVHAVASPYRERSHFDAQQVLESGGNRPFEHDTGWLGRGLALAGRNGVALGPALPLALRGAPGASSWAPSRQPEVDDDLVARVARLYEADAELGPMFAQAREQRRGSLAGAMAEARGDMAAGGAVGAAAGGAAAAGWLALARQAGRFLAVPDGPAMAWLEAGGWDTHAQQAGRLARGLEALDQGLVALRESLGERWASTTVLVLTEFGRSAAMNGSAGTDHGTGGVAFAAGGRVAGGKVLADWPGLATAQLFEGRDLRPTLDLRSLFVPVLQRHLGLSSAQIERQVLPGAPRGQLELWRA